MDAAWGGPGRAGLFSPRGCGGDPTAGVPCWTRSGALNRPTASDPRCRRVAIVPGGTRDRQVRRGSG
eukprot:5780266-Pyramimonas_sp.AAC.1